MMGVWRTLQLGKFLKPYRVEHIIQNEQDYRQVTISKIGVISLRGVKSGSKIGRKRQFQINLKNNPNTVLFTRQGLLGGSIGLAPPEVDGCVVTENMPMMSVDINVINIDYLKKLLLSEYLLEKVRQLTAVGSAQKSIHERDLLRVEIELPELDEQLILCRKFASLDSEQTLLRNELTYQRALIKKLRQQILQEAIEGKLTTDWRAANPDTEPASELLKRIAAEKTALLKAKKIKKQKPLPPISDEEKPFKLPDGWAWCRLGEVSEFVSGNNFLSTDFKKGKGIKCIKITNAGVGKIIETDERLPQEFSNKFKQYLVYEKDIVLALTRPYILDGLKVSRCPTSYHNSLLNQRVAVIRSNHILSQEYCYLFLKSEFVLSGYKSEFDAKGQQPNLKKDHVTHLRLPLPPISEQKTIVGKVEKLLALCDQLETQITQNQTHADALMQAVLSEAFTKTPNKNQPAPNRQKRHPKRNVLSSERD